MRRFTVPKNIAITEECQEWIKTQPEYFNFSGWVREQIYKMIEDEDSEE